MTAKEEDRREPSARTEIKEWKGIILGVDPHSLPASASPDCINCHSVVVGALSVRRGVSTVKFSE